MKKIFLSEVAGQHKKKIALLFVVALGILIITLYEWLHFKRQERLNTKYEKIIAN